MVELYHRYKNENFDILGLAGSETSRERWIQAIEADGLVWTQINMRENDPEELIAKKYNIRGYPTKLLLDPEERILAYNLGGYDEIKALLKEIFGF